VLTDSGGVQKEAFFFRKPCVILRSETEWVELVKCGAAILADAEKDRIIAAVRSLSGKNIEFPGLFGDGKAAEFMCNEMLRHFSKA
jgi:UDP-GlcNAc3NAcA epimerase